MQALKRALSANWRGETQEQAHTRRAQARTRRKMAWIVWTTSAVVLGLVKLAVHYANGTGPWT